MPELAEVEFYRRVWDSGLGGSIRSVCAHIEKRVFRETDATALMKRLRGSVFHHSEAHGKQMLFKFSKGGWVGLHLGMTGELRVEKASFTPGKHDHLVLYQTERALVFSDARQFGRVRFHPGAEPPEWWSNLPVPLLSNQFTQPLVSGFLSRHGKLPLKAALLLQNGFPGLGNWMVDEILWRAGLSPQMASGNLTPAELNTLWRTIRFVCRQALASVSRGYSAFPAGWLFHQRWTKEGKCPKHGKLLRRETVGGRTTAWCEVCQAGGS